MDRLERITSTLLVVAVVIKFTDFSLKNPMDVIILILTAIYTVLSLIDLAKKKGE